MKTKHIDCVIDDKNPMPGHLFELHPVNEVNTKGQ